MQSNLPQIATIKNEATNLEDDVMILRKWSCYRCWYQNEIWHESELFVGSSISMMILKLLLKKVNHEKETFRVTYFIHIIDQTLTSFKDQFKQFEVYDKKWIFVKYKVYGNGQRRVYRIARSYFKYNQQCDAHTHIGAFNDTPIPQHPASPLISSTRPGLNLY